MIIHRYSHGIITAAEGSFNMPDIWIWDIGIEYYEMSFLRVCGSDRRRRK